MYIGTQQVTYTEHPRPKNPILQGVLQPQKKEWTLIVLVEEQDVEISTGNEEQLVTRRRVYSEHSIEHEGGKVPDLQEGLDDILTYSVLNPESHVFVAPINVTSALKQIDKQFRTVTVTQCDTIRAKCNEFFLDCTKIIWRLCNLFP